MSKNYGCLNYNIAKAEADKVDEQIISALKAGRSFRVEAGPAPFSPRNARINPSDRPTGANDELYFRDFLREHSDAAKDYETLKLSLYLLCTK